MKLKASKAAKTKVVVRHLPPTLKEQEFQEAVDGKGFQGKYNWLSFHAGKLT